MQHARAHGRHSLPWRATHDPYAVLVSEFMLQQTPVHRVVAYFERWMQIFPKVHALADAPLPTVLAEWNGLGYNRRAKLLHECAKKIVEEWGGTIPRDRAALESLPGIGPYTAGAIRAFAFDEPDVFIETNIRAACIHHFFPRTQSVSDEQLLPILKRILSRTRSSRAWYAALMDYGAYIKKSQVNPSRRSRHHTKQKPFFGSMREMRGAIVRTLIARASLRGLSGDKRFLHAIHALEREGIVVHRGSSWKLANNE